MFTFMHYVVLTSEGMGGLLLCSKYFVLLIILDVWHQYLLNKVQYQLEEIQVLTKPP